MRAMYARNTRQAGFTLLEVMVALAIVAIALAAIIKGSSEMAGNAIYLRDRTMSNWVAGNVLTELQITEAWQTETREGEARMGAGNWTWEAEIQNTPNPALRRVDVRVFGEADPDTPISVLSGLLADPAQTDSQDDQQAPRLPGGQSPGLPDVGR